MSLDLPDVEVHRLHLLVSLHLVARVPPAQAHADL